MSEVQRRASVERSTRETQIRLDLDLDGRGNARVGTGIGFFDHMLTALAFNALFDVVLSCQGDLEVDQHHTVEDVGIALGQAVKQALGGAAGAVRYGHMVVPMDEAAVRCVLDLSGRAYLHFDVDWEANLGQSSFDYRLTREFYWGFCRAAGATLHVQALTAGNNHHLCEASFKAFGRALGQAVTVDPRRAGAVPSTKGVIE